MIEEVLQFWFGTLPDEKAIPERSKFWFRKDVNFDESIRSQFLPTWEEAKTDKLSGWESSPRGVLALTLVRDQFSRNLFRNSPRAFEQDAAALALSLRALRDGTDKKLFPIQRAFLYLPLEHSEDLEIQNISVMCFENLTDTAPAELKAYFADTLLYAKRHHEIIERFGRFPHRNEVLKRASTKEEIEFLKEPMSSF